MAPGFGRGFFFKVAFAPMVGVLWLTPHRRLNSPSESGSRSRYAIDFLHVHADSFLQDAICDRHWHRVSRFMQEVCSSFFTEVVEPELLW